MSTYLTQCRRCRLEFYAEWTDNPFAGPTCPSCRFNGAAESSARLKRSFGELFSALGELFRPGMLLGLCGVGSCYASCHDGPWWSGPLGFLMIYCAGQLMPKKG